MSCIAGIAYHGQTHRCVIHLPIARMSRPYARPLYYFNRMRWRFKIEFGEKKPVGFSVCCGYDSKVILIGNGRGKFNGKLTEWDCLASVPIRCCLQNSVGLIVFAVTGQVLWVNVFSKYVAN